MKLESVVSQNKVLTQETLETDEELLTQVQTRLAQLGYYPPHRVDGLWGLMSEGALISFCLASHLNNHETKKYGATWAKALITGIANLISSETATSIFGRSPSSEQLADLNTCLGRFQINTPPRMRHFLSQVAHESGGLKWLKELASGEAYEGRRDLGNCHPGDGRRFKGAGCLQVTGRANYQALADYLKDPRVMEGCDYVSRVYPMTASGHWWLRNGMNALCDRGASVEQVTRRVNGGINGLSDRKKYYAIACKVIK